MDNTKRNVHNSGPLGMLVKSGQIKKIDLMEEPNQINLQHVGLEGLKLPGSYFKTQSGIQFSANELVFLDPNECEPWEYANRLEDEMGEMEELIKSIRTNGQLQPALVRVHPQPYGQIKYQVIFGRRRHTACLSLGVKFLAIKKDTLSVQEAICCQNAENKFRQNVSNYSNAILYKKLLDNKAFGSEKELAEKLGMSYSTFGDLMTYAKIPMQLVTKIPNIHKLSTYMAIKIVRLLSAYENAFDDLIRIAPQIGKTINTPSKLEASIQGKIGKAQNVPRGTRIIQNDAGKKMFTFRIDHKGVPLMVFNKDLIDTVNFDQLCDQIKDSIEHCLKTGRPVCKTDV